MIPITLMPADSTPSTVRIVIGRTMTVRGAVSNGALREALNVTALERCYVETVDPSAPKSLHAELEIATELSGRIESATLRGRGLPQAFVTCVEEIVRFGRVRDTGHISVIAFFDVLKDCLCAYCGAGSVGIGTGAAGAGFAFRARVCGVQRRCAEGRRAARARCGRESARERWWDRADPRARELSS